MTCLKVIQLSIDLGGKEVRGRKETGTPRDAFLADRRNVVGRWIDARLATGGWFCRWCMSKDVRAAPSFPLPPPFFSLFFSPSFFSSLLFSSHPISSLFSCVLSLQLCRGSTILSRGSVVDRYFVPAEDLVLTFPAPHREYLCRPTGMVVEGGSVACLFVCFPSASPNTAGKPACPLTRLKIFRHPVCTLCSKLLEFAQ